MVACSTCQESNENTNKTIMSSELRKRIDCLEEKIVELENVISKLTHNVNVVIDKTHLSSIAQKF